MVILYCMTVGWRREVDCSSFTGGSKSKLQLSTFIKKKLLGQILQDITHYKDNELKNDYSPSPYSGETSLRKGVRADPQVGCSRLLQIASWRRYLWGRQNWGPRRNRGQYSAISVRLVSTLGSAASTSFPFRPNLFQRLVVSRWGGTLVWEETD